MPAKRFVFRLQTVLEIKLKMADAMVLVDNMDVGTGAQTNAILKPGTHNVQIKWRGKEHREKLVVRAGRRTQWAPELPW